MSERHEPGMAYDMQKLNKVFAFLSILFLMTTFWVFVDDYMRPWKAVQVEAMNIKKEKLKKDIAAENKKIDEAKLEKIKADITAGEKLVEDRKLEIKKISSELLLVQRDLKDETIINGKLNASIGEVNFNWELAHAHHEKNKSKKLFAKLKQLKADFAKSRDNLKFLGSKEKALKKQINNLKREKKTAEKELNAMVGTRDLLQMSLDKVDLAITKDNFSHEKLRNLGVFVVRNLPMVDFLDPTVKIQQIVLEKITDDRFFQQVPKVDRCTTCHTFIDQKGFEDQANPHKTHPNLDMYLGAKSPHPIKEIGCTVCHGGEGHRVLDFNAAAHTPRDDEQKAEWAEKYGWHEPHKVPDPMLPVGMTEAACVKCHRGTTHIQGATVFNEGRSNFEKHGCYACHKIDHPEWDNKRKPGPALTKVASKVSKEFFKNWVWDPKGFNSHAKMPRFFGNDNNSKPEFMKKNIAEVNAMAEFIWSISEDYTPSRRYTGGNAERGKELIKEVGCMGCHGAEGWESESEKVDAYAGPYLKGLGSKLDADWLVTWLKKPSEYHPGTIMPSFRLSDREANDIAAYLMSSKNEKFEQLKFEKLDKETRDEILVTYLSAFDTIEGAKGQLASMSDRERTLELGRRSVGKYGCYSCHDIKGFEGRAPIGPELTKIGAKPITQFGFAHEKVDHNRRSWIKAHLLNPRRWDNGIDKPFKDLTRMPYFGMSEREAYTITVSLLGLRGDTVPPKGMKQLSANERIYHKGMKVIEKYNCAGCHQIDGMGGDILKMFEDDINEGPPRLVDQGHRVQSDWFNHFLNNVYPIRPWLKVRMPSFNFTDEERNKIVSAFQRKSDQPTFVNNTKKVVWEPGEKSAAKALFEDYACASCHTQGFNNDDPLAPHLYYAKKRLRPTWIKKWLRNPQAILPGTTMPNFWEDGVSQNEDILGGDMEKQINALTKYILEIGYEKYHQPARRD